MTEGELQVQKAKQNFIALKSFFNDVHNQGIIRIESVFTDLNRTDNIYYNYQAVLNMYTNALYSVNNQTSNYFAANIASYNSLRPVTLLGNNYSSIRECFDAVYAQGIIHLDEFINKTELYWENTCNGYVYLPTDFFQLQIVLNEVVNSVFIQNTDPGYSDAVSLAVDKLELSLRHFLSGY